MHSKNLNLKHLAHLLHIFKTGVGEHLDKMDINIFLNSFIQLKKHFDDRSKNTVLSYMGTYVFLSAKSMGENKKKISETHSCLLPGLHRSYFLFLFEEDRGSFYFCIPDAYTVSDQLCAFMCLC